MLGEIGFYFNLVFKLPCLDMVVAGRERNSLCCECLEVYTLTFENIFIFLFSIKRLFLLVLK